LKEDYNSHEIGSLIEFILKIKNDDILMDLRYYMCENITWYPYVSINDNVINAVNNGDFSKFEKELEKLEYQKNEYIKLMKDKIDIDYNEMNDNIKKHIEDMAKEMFELIED
jgi:hypothetical protein